MTTAQESPLVSVVIPTLCRYPSLKRTLECLDACVYPRTETLIVDQTPGGPPSDFPRTWKNARWIMQGKKNLPAARNRGLSEARGEIILFIDDDVAFGPEFVSEHVTAHLAHPDADAVAGRIRLEPPHFWMEQDKTAFLDPETAKFHANFDKTGGGPAEFFCGCNFSLKRTTLEKVRRFDASFRGNALYEEIDYCVRLKSKGGRIRFHPGADLLHGREDTGGCRQDRGRRYFFLKFYNTAYLYAKHLLRGYPLPFLRAMKNEIEFYTRKEKGHALSDAALYVLALKTGALRGLLKRFLAI